MRHSIREAWRACFGEDITKAARSGKEQFRTRCPFHKDERPSMDVSTGKDAFICRACGAAGGVLDLVIMAGNAQRKSEAAQWLDAHLPPR